MKDEIKADTKTLQTARNYDFNERKPENFAESRTMQLSILGRKIDKGGGENRLQREARKRAGRSPRALTSI